jgi:hypothetical protein
MSKNIFGYNIISNSENNNGYISYIGYTSYISYTNYIKYTKYIGYIVLQNQFSREHIIIK